MAPIGQPLYIFLCAGMIGAVVALTSPVWMRLAVKAWQAFRHQVDEAASVIENEINRSEKEDK